MRKQELLERIKELEEELKRLRIELVREMTKYNPHFVVTPGQLVSPQPWEPPVTTVTITDGGSDKPQLWRTA